MGKTFNRSLCIISQQEDGHLLHLGPPSPSVCCGCFFRDMGQDVRLCFSSNLSGSQSLAAYKKGTVSTHSHSSKWPRRHWYPELLQLCIANPIRLPSMSDLLSQPRTIIYHPNPKIFSLNAWLLSTDSSQQKAFHRKLASCYQPPGGQGPRGII